MDFRKRVDESGRQLNLKRGEVAQAERALNERETSVKRLQSAMASLGAEEVVDSVQEQAAAGRSTSSTRGAARQSRYLFSQVSSQCLAEVTTFGQGCLQVKGGRGGVLVFPTSQGLCFSKPNLFRPFLILICS